MKVVIDHRMRKEEKEYLKRFGSLIEIQKQNLTYDEIDSHPDIFLCQIKKDIICAPCIKNLFENAIVGKKNPGKEYPNDVLYNVCNIGNYVIGNFKYVDQSILEFIDENELQKIEVKQGYSNCSICKINDKACITSDEGIYNELIKYDIDVLLIKTDKINLLSNNSFSNMKGFFGGATAVIENELIIFGDINNFDKEDIENINAFTNKYKIKIVDFSGKDIIDYGGVVFT